MDFRHMSDGIHLHHGHHGHGTPAPSWSSIDSSSHSVIGTGDNSAGNGGDGYFFGSLVNAPVVIYKPINIAIAGHNSTAAADQSNTVQIDQSATQIAGVGGDGGNGNASIGGNVTASGSGDSSLSSAAISSGGQPIKVAHSGVTRSVLMQFPLAAEFRSHFLRRCDRQ